MCPECTILPIKAGDEALDPTDNLAKAWQFAADEGARVIVSVTADLGYSPVHAQVLDYSRPRESWWSRPQRLRLDRPPGRHDAGPM